MALTAVGFTGTVDAVEDAKRSQFQGAVLPVVGAQDAFLVAANLGGSLACTVAPGPAWAHGVKVVNDAVINKTFSAVTVSGQNRWDAVVLRRNWSGSGSVSVVVVEGSAGVNAQPVLPSGLNDSPGVIHDQVLALVPWKYGSTVPSAPIIDKRLWASKVFTALTYAALPSPSLALYGVDAYLIDGTRYRCLLDGSNSPAWLLQGASRTKLVQSQVLTTAAGWTGGSLNSVASYDATTASIALEVRRQSASLGGGTLTASGTAGNFSDTPICTLAQALWPEHIEVVPILYAAGTGFGWLGGFAELDTKGVLTLLSGAPGQDLLPGGNTTEDADGISIRASLSGYARKVS